MLPHLACSPAAASAQTALRLGCTVHLQQTRTVMHCAQLSAGRCGFVYNPAPAILLKQLCCSVALCTCSYQGQLYSLLRSQQGDLGFVYTPALAVFTHLHKQLCCCVANAMLLSMYELLCCCPRDNGGLRFVPWIIENTVWFCATAQSVSSIAAIAEYQSARSCCS